MDVLSEEYISSANEELKTRQCPLPGCEAVGLGSVAVAYEATDNFALSGMQDKVSVIRFLRYECQGCGQKARLRQ